MGRVEKSHLLSASGLILPGCYCEKGLAKPCKLRVGISMSLERCRELSMTLGEREEGSSSAVSPRDGPAAVGSLAGEGPVLPAVVSNAVESAVFIVGVVPR